MNFKIGDTVGGYEIVGILGSGGMGEVYRVRNVISDRVDAMKVLLAGLQRDNDFATRFLREIKVQARLVHPNIAQLYTAFENQGNLMMILELIEGMSLAEMLQRGRVPLANAIDYASQALTALSYAHQQGVIHRDIKPGNIMVTRAGSVKLMDFGIAKAASDHSLTTTGNLIGSLYYMSPEQVRAEVVDGRADLYSLGIVLYQMATGKKPFEGASEYTLMRAQVEQLPAPPQTIDPAVPEELNRVILRVLEKDPAARFQSGEEFRAALQPIAARLWQGQSSATSMLAGMPGASDVSPAARRVPEPLAPPVEQAVSQPPSSRVPPLPPLSRPLPPTAEQQPVAAAHPVTSPPPASKLEIKPVVAELPPSESRSRTPMWIGVAVAIAVLIVAATQLFDWMAAGPREHPAQKNTTSVDIEQAARSQPPASGIEPIAQNRTADSNAPAPSVPTPTPEKQPAPIQKTPERTANPITAQSTRPTTSTSAPKVGTEAALSRTGKEISAPPTPPHEAAPVTPVEKAANPPAAKSASPPSSPSPPPSSTAPQTKAGPEGNSSGSPATGSPQAKAAQEPPPPVVQTPPEHVYEPSEVDVAPRLLIQVQPLYTQAARNAGVQGRVRLEAEIWPDGRAHNIRVVQSVGHADLDRNAMAALARWQFSPGRKGGTAVKVRALIDQNYRLQGNNSAPALSKEN